jgi:hypothetical protein
MCYSILDYINNNLTDYFNIQVALEPKKPDISNQYPHCNCCCAEFETYKRMYHYKPPVSKI